MDIIVKVRRATLQVVGGLVLAFGLGLFVWCLCFIPATTLDVRVISVKTMFYLMFFWAFPVGCPLGMSMVDKLIFKSPTYNVLGIAIGLSLSLIGMAIAFWIPAILGVRIDIFLLPLIAVFFSLIGYKVGSYRFKNSD